MNRSSLHAVLALAVAATAANPALSGAEIYSTSTVTYGRWEIRMQVAAVPGSVSSFFTYNDDSWRGDPYPWREIDIEILGNKPKGFQSNLITGDAGSKVMTDSFHVTEDSLSRGFHTYVLDWTPDSVVWRIDGETVRTTLLDPDVEGEEDQVESLQDREETWRMNLWASSSSAWVGKIDTAKLPVVQTVNWIAFSEYTPGQGPDGSDFTESWVDDFDEIDANSWALGDWTFDENLATFTAENAKAENGYLALLLSTEGTAGVFPEIPTDELGSERTTALAKSVAARPTAFRIAASRLSDGAWRIEVPEGGLELRDARGALVRRLEAGSRRVEGLPSGVLLVRGAAGSGILAVP